MIFQPKFFLQRFFVLLAHMYRIFLLSNKDLNRFSSVDNLLKEDKANVAKHQCANGSALESRDAVLVHLAHLDSKYLHILDHKGRLISESTRWPNENVLLSRATSLYMPRSFYTNSGSELPKIALGSDSYYHWLIEQLPAFIRLRNEFPDYEVLCFQKRPKYVSDFLEEFSIDCANVPKFVKINKLVFYPLDKNIGMPNLMELKILREMLSTKFISNELAKESLKLYVSRVGSSRSPRFEKRLEQYLSENGWKIVRAEALSFREQYLLFSRARVVMGLHGAGLANTVFLPEGSLVGEIKSTTEDFFGGYISTCYSNISKTLNNRHFLSEVTDGECAESRIPETIISFIKNLEANSKQ